MDADWDTLLIADAARADLFEECVDHERFDKYRRVESRESATAEWSRVNFTDDYGDTVYVTGNPATSKHITGSFHDYIEIWQDGLDDQLGTTPADAVADAARKAHGDYPNKRLIVHFVQSHYPLVPDDRFQFEFWQGTDGLEFGDDTRASQVWEAIGLGLADPDDVWSAYRDNLEYVMDHAWDLIEDLDGKTVVHSDHGNALGSRSWPIPVKTYGHPMGLRLSELVTVPWAVVEGERRIVRDDGANQRGHETEEMEERLRALGYTE